MAEYNSDLYEERATQLGGRTDARKSDGATYTATSNFILPVGGLEIGDTIVIDEFPTGTNIATVIVGTPDLGVGAVLQVYDSAAVLIAEFDVSIAAEQVLHFASKGIAKGKVYVQCVGAAWDSAGDSIVCRVQYVIDPN